MALIDTLSQLLDIKNSLKTALGTSSDAFDEYPNLIENYMIDRYNEGYRAGWLAATGNTYSGNKKSHVTYTPTVPSWQGQDTTEYATLVNIMTSVASIRESMKTAARLNTSSNVFANYPSRLTTQGTTQYNNGYAAGQADGTSSTPQKSPTPIISVSGNNVLITCSSCTGLTWWITSSASGSPANTHFVAATTASYTITSADSGKYIRAYSNTNGMNNSDYATSSQLVYVTPEEPVVEIPDTPTWYRISNTNNIHIKSETGTTIFYSVNGGVSYSQIQSNSGTIVITSNKSSGQIKAYCKNTTSGQQSLTITWPGTFELYVAPDSGDPTQPGTPQSTPFWIKGTGTTNKYPIGCLDSSRIEVSEYKDFRTLITANDYRTADTGNYLLWDLEPNKYYYIRTTSTTAIAPPKFITNTIRVGTPTGLKIAIGGNLQYLSNKNGTAGTLPADCFKEYFKGTSTEYWPMYLADISQLYFPNGGSHSYDSMFMNCNNITTVPASITCAIGSYTCSHMFDHCSGITRLPAITATSVGENGCEYMFYYCSGATSAGNISTTTLGVECFRYMYGSCTSLLTGPEELPATVPASTCYREMFDSCRKLTKAPIIRLSSLVSSCCRYMFWSCAALSEVEVHFVTWPTDNYQTGSWMSSVASSGTFKIGSECTWSPTDHSGTSGIPTGWPTVNV